MSGIPSLSRTSPDPSTAPRPDRATLAVSKALQEKKREAEAMIRLIESTSAADKGQLVDYRA